jgi:hypothetical protein
MFSRGLYARAPAPGKSGLAPQRNAIAALNTQIKPWCLYNKWRKGLMEMGMHVHGFDRARQYLMKSMILDQWRSLSATAD